MHVLLHSFELKYQMVVTVVVLSLNHDFICVSNLWLSQKVNK